MTTLTYDRAYYHQLESDIARLLTDVRSFEAIDPTRIQEFLEVGEYGLAFEVLCEAVKSVAMSLPADVRHKFLVLGERMAIDPNEWFSTSVNSYDSI